MAKKPATKRPAAKKTSAKKAEFRVRPGGANTQEPCEACNGTGRQGGGPSKWICERLEAGQVTEAWSFGTEAEAKARAKKGDR